MVTLFYGEEHPNINSRTTDDGHASIVSGGCHSNWSCSNYRGDFMLHRVRLRPSHGVGRVLVNLKAPGAE